MTITDLLKSGKLTREGILRLVESLVEGETHVDVETGEILICYGSAPQSYATYEDVTGYTTIDDLAELFNSGWKVMMESQPYSNFIVVAEILGIEFEI